MRVGICLVLLLAACGGRDRRASDASASGDAGGLDGAGATGDGGGAADAAGTDGAAADAGPPRGDAAVGGCGADEVDPLAGVPRSCRDEPACYDHPLCVTALLEADGRGDYTECGEPISFDPASSDEVCNLGPPFGDWTPELVCGRASFEGTVRFFCSPDGAVLLLRFSGTVRAATDGEHYSYYGHDYWTGSGGGSGYSRSLSTPLDDTSGEAFVDLEPIGRTSDGAGGHEPVSVTLYFITGGLIDMSYFIGGGVQVSHPDGT